MKKGLVALAIVVLAVIAGVVGLQAYTGVYVKAHWTDARVISEMLEERRYAWLRGGFDIPPTPSPEHGGEDDPPPPALTARYEPLFFFEDEKVFVFLGNTSSPYLELDVLSAVLTGSNMRFGYAIDPYAGDQWGDDPNWLAVYILEQDFPAYRWVHSWLLERWFSLDILIVRMRIALHDLR